ncbi:MAG: glycerol-3-phosphate dehydrogenase/oxidase [Chitinophagales bacterium]
MQQNSSAATYTHPMSTFSANKRAQYLSKLQSQTFDLLVIGGGITGAGVALDAISRGLSVALIEKDDFAAGTSSKSTKLIHGGLRYLKQLEFSLVREVGRERAIIHRNAPHIVIPENMLLPIVKDGALGKKTTSLGLYVYDRLAGVRKEERRKMLSAKKTAKKEPLLRTDILKGGGIYKEYRTDDARLVVEVLKSAVERGTLALNYTKANAFIYENKKAVGIEATDTLSGEKMEIRAAKIINAAGPWVDELRRIDKSMNKKRLHLTKGVHLVVPFEKLPLKQSIYFDIEDGRMMFAIPRGKVTYLGTTDTNYNADIDSPDTSKADAEYLLNAVNYMLPEVNLKLQDVVSSWAGLRPLIHEEGKEPSELSRKDEIFRAKSGVISIAGGKLTGFRKMAERSVDIVCRELRRKNNKHCKKCKTDKIVLSGGSISTDLNNYIEDRHGEAKQIKADHDQIKELVLRYGSNTDQIINKAYELRKEISDPYELLLAAEIFYVIENEMVNTINDFMIRRTGRLYFQPQDIDKDLPIVEKYLSRFLNKDQATLEKEQAAFAKERKAVLAFRES